MVFYERYLQKERRQLSLGLVFVAAAIAIIWFGGLSLLEYADSGLIPDDAASRRTLSSNLSRTGITLISTVFACLFLAIPLTANMYTPLLIPAFVRARTNALMLGFFVFSGATCMWTSRLPMNTDACVVPFRIALVLVMTSLVLLLPYLFSVFRFLEPRTIVARMYDSIVAAMSPPSYDDVHEEQERLGERIRQLGNTILKALERSDRDLALAGVEALCSSARHYEKIKSQYKDSWFNTGPQHFPGFSRSAKDAVHAQRSWVEMEILLQLSRAYKAALARMPDVISAISRSQRVFALTASENGDHGALQLTVKFFNNFLRESIARKDIHAVFDLSYQIRVLAMALWAQHPDEVLEIGQRLVYYAAMARNQNMPFATDLLALDLGRFVSDLANEDGPLDELCSALLSIRVDHVENQEVLSKGIAQARLLCAARMRHAGRKEIAVQIETSLEAAQPMDWQFVAADLVNDPPELFWEVTDRQENLFYSEGPIRELIQEMAQNLSDRE